MEYNIAFQFFKQSLILLQKSIVPLYKMDLQKGRHEFVGSSVYCKFGPIMMLFSAGHVFKDILQDRAWYPYSMTEMRELPCEKYSFPNDDTNDSGIAVLNENLPMWSPITYELFSTFKQGEDYHHILVGYPGSSAKGSTSKIQKLEIKGYLTSAATNEEYSRLQVDQMKEFIVLFKKKNVYGEKHNKFMFPNPNGMSGGGVFQFHEKNPNIQFLVGIMTRWDVNKKNVIIATRIESITKLFDVVKINKI